MEIKYANNVCITNVLQSRNCEHLSNSKIPSTVVYLGQGGSSVCVWDREVVQYVSGTGR